MIWDGMVDVKRAGMRRENKLSQLRANRPRRRHPEKNRIVAIEEGVGMIWSFSKCPPPAMRPIVLIRWSRSQHLHSSTRSA